MRLPYRILVLEDDEHTLEGIVELLREAGHNVTGASTYDAAKRLLAVGPYDLLITDVRLRAFNGLHIVMRSRVDYPEMAVIIISGYDEPLMEIEASRYHATFVAKPIKAGEFLKTVSEMLAAVRRQRRWPRKRVVGGFRVTAAGRTAAVVDVSYGGLRLELPGPREPAEDIRRRSRRHRPAPRGRTGLVLSLARNRRNRLRRRHRGRAHPRGPDLARHRRSPVGVISHLDPRTPNPAKDLIH